MQTIEHISGRRDQEQNLVRRDRSANGNEFPASGPAKTTAPTKSNKLPPAKRTRWIAHRKAEIVAAVCGGSISLAEAQERYALSIEEFLSWVRGVELFGLTGLQVYRSQSNRRVKSDSPDL
jgi:Protein of unknown function (DUF1153)